MKTNILKNLFLLFIPLLLPSCIHLQKNTANNVPTTALFSITPQEYTLLAHVALKAKNLNLSFLEVIKKTHVVDTPQHHHKAFLASGPTLYEFIATHDDVPNIIYIAPSLAKKSNEKRMIRFLAMLYRAAFSLSIPQNAETKFIDANTTNAQWQEGKHAIHTLFNPHTHLILQKNYFKKNKKVLEVSYSDYQNVQGYMLPFTVNIHHVKRDCTLTLVIKKWGKTEN